MAISHPREAAVSSNAELSPHALNIGMVKLGAGLMGVGMLLASGGAALCAAAFAGALRARINAAEVPPSVVAKAQLRRAKVAAQAGIGAAWSAAQTPDTAGKSPASQISSVG
jgi:hypothetical protein